MPTSPRTSGVRTRVWSVGRFFILIAALCVTFGAFFLAGLRVTTRAREVKVPNLAGKSVSEARTLLGDQGLVLRVDEQRRPDKAVPVDHVLTQEPAAGETVRRQRAIRVRLSDGQRGGAVPSLVGLPESTAEITLSGDAVTIGYRAEIHSPDYDPGAIVAQDPPAQQRTDKVNLLVNRGSDTQDFVVPDLIGTLGSRSADLLRSLKFRIAVTSEVPYPGLPPGIVVKQTPQPGFRIVSGETITLEVSR
jgi:beta-lactam-binding protein with PASTA domain